MNITTARCPRCGGSTFHAHFTGLIDLALNAPQLVVTTYSWPDGPSDTFVDLTCDGCQLTLANEAGETRLRRADIYDGHGDLSLDEPMQWDPADLNAPARALYDGMMEIALRLCDEVNNLDTEVINEVVE